MHLALLGWLELFAGAAPNPAPPPAQCAALSATVTPFRPGEELHFQLDAVGLHAGQLTLRVHPVQDGTMALEGRGESSGFLSGIRKVTGKAVSLVELARLQPSHFSEESTDNGAVRSTEVSFLSSEHRVRVQYRIHEQDGELQQAAQGDVRDGLSALYALREVALTPGARLCLDVYGLRRLWRLSGQVVQREHVSLHLGEFEAWHLRGEAVRLDDFSQRRRLDIWISDDARRLPLVVVGALDTGVVRATLDGFRRPGERPRRAQSTSSMAW